LARQIGGVHLRIDSIEQAIRGWASVDQPLDDVGYRVAYSIAEDNLRIGTLPNLLEAPRDETEPGIPETALRRQTRTEGPVRGWKHGAAKARKECRHGR